MKRVVIAVFAILGVLIAGIVYVVSYKADDLNYERDWTRYAAACVNSRAAMAHSGDERMWLTQENLGKLQSILTFTDRRKLIFKKDCEGCECISVDVNDMHIEVYNYDGDNDIAYVVATTPKKTRRYFFEGYKTFYWVSVTVSEKGYYGQNNPFKGNM